MPATLSPGPATRLTVYVKVNAHWHHRSVHTEIVHRAHAAGLAGASVFRGDEGFGRSETIHSPHLFSLNGESPCAIVIVDSDERIRAFLPQLEEILDDGIAFVEPVEVVRYVGRQDGVA